MVNLEWTDGPDAATTSRVRELLVAARATDGRPDIGADGSLPGELRGGRALLARQDGELVGYAHLDTVGDAFGRQVAELIVRPDRRGAGVATEMLPELVRVTGAAADGTGDTLRVWSHGDHPAAAALARRAGFRRQRELLVMRAAPENPEQRWPHTPMPEGLRLRTFVPGADDAALLDVNARAFAWHPEQGALSAAELRAEQEQDWFDPDGLFLAEDEQGTLAGFHWTKIHPPNPHRFDGAAAGEVYVLGVAPEAQGSGLGKALTIAGLRYLHSRGPRQMILYVEGDNTAAVTVYRKLGFELHETDVQYAA